MAEQSSRRVRTARTQKLRRLDDPSSAGPQRALVIEDDDVLQRQALAAFAAAGWNALGASDLLAAVDLAMKHQPSLVVTELLLPDTRGFQFGRTLRSAVDHDIQLVAITRAADALIEQALAAGFDLVLRKPATIESVLRTLKAPLPR